jgi:glycine amidinotransferase/scyllo-inosamine-4-phosphate amidinotransferase 1
VVNVSTHSEWDPLKQVVVGSATGMRIPTVKDESLHSVCFGALSDEDFARIRTGPIPQRIVEETNEDLEAFAATLAGMGVRVHRPQPADFSEIYATEHWRVDGYHAYCPRDAILTVGREAIETPMCLRHRQNEARVYRHIMRTVPAPRPKLLDSLYDRSMLGRPTLRNDEPAFDAANCLKMGYDLLFLISNTGNDAGADWLQEHLGREYRIHRARDVYAFVHIDSTIVPLRPGLVLLCPDRVNERNLPEYFRGWDKVYAPEPDPTDFDPAWNGASKWIALNCLSVSPDLVVVEQRQTRLMRELERHGLTCCAVRLRHARTLGGGPHCVSLDLVREGEAADYR